MSENPEESEKPNLYLVGFMGTGKTTLGRRVARALGYEFVDSDVEIEKSCGMKISDIFAKFGEKKFREMERKFLEGGHRDSGCVVACGGGLVCFPGMPELVRSKGVCIVLFASAEEIYERVKNGKSRPLLNVDNPLERINSLLKDRTPAYLKSGIAISAGPDMAETEAHILRVYRAEIRRRKNDAQKRNANAAAGAEKPDKTE